METRTFGAEAKQLLDLMIHSVYSNKEIFLRELVSNASDALDKLRFLALTSDVKADDLAITLETAPGRLIVRDNGVGMTRDEVIANIGTIAKSGTREMLAQAKEKQVDLIGQFGVGFYSVFMVADKVELVTRKAGETTATRWESTGDGTYAVEDATKEGQGTTITLHLKPRNDDDGIEDFTDAAVLERIVKKHSDFVGYPVKLGDKTLNSMKPIWSRSGVTDDEYAEFYRHISHDWNAPKKHIAFKAEGTFEYQALLFIPERAPMDLFFRDGRRGLQLYVRKVLIKEQCEELLPTWLRFVRGVVDSADLPLNVSRELLQHNQKLAAIKKRLTKKVVDTLTGDQALFDGVYEHFAPLIKEGAATDADAGEKLRPLLTFDSTKGKIALKDYPGDTIFYISGDNKAAVERSPHLEGYKDHAVLFFTDPVDELVAAEMKEFNGKPLKSVAKGEAPKASIDKETEEKYAHLVAHLRQSLNERVKEVRLTDRLRDSAVCLVCSEEGLSPHLERMLKQAGQAIPPQKRILELNPKHAQIEALLKRLTDKRDDVVLQQYAQLLYGQALLAEGSPLPDPAEFAKLVADLVVRAEA